MAGIGFELKKIYRKNHVFNMLRGIGYSSVVTVGPTLISIGTIILLYQLLGIMSVKYSERELLSSTILYCFIFPLIIITPFNAVISRYISDKIFQEKLDDILSSYYMGLFLTSLIAAIIAIPFAVRLYLVSDLGVTFVFVSYCLFILVLFVYYSMTYLTATKDYKIITIQFIIGMLVAIASGFLFVWVMELSVIRGVFYALTMGFLYIAIGEFAYIKRYFNKTSNNYKEILVYLLRFKRLFLSGLFYILGLYCHNFVFWKSELGIIVANSYITAPTYDMASYLAMLTNISTMVIFIVIVETNFHDRYQLYSEAVIRATLRDINKTKGDMFRLLLQQLSYVVQVQAIISGIIFLIVVIFLPSFGFSGKILVIYPAMAAGYLVIFIMYCNIIFLYYFNDVTGALITSLLFFLGVLSVSILASHYQTRFYGIGTFIGAFIGWTFSFFRIRYLERHFTEHIFLRGRIISIKRKKMPSSVAYQRISPKSRKK